jgi:hypothetical protein
MHSLDDLHSNVSSEGGTLRRTIRGRDEDGRDDQIGPHLPEEE